MSSEGPTLLPEAFAPDQVRVMNATDRRRRAAEMAARCPMPTSEAEEWRYTPLDLLNLEGLSPQAEPAHGTAADALAGIGSRAATVHVVDGWVTQVDLDPGWAAKGLSAGPSTAARAEAGPGDDIFDVLHLAFAPDALRISVAAGLDVTDPIVVLDHHTGGPVVAFPHIEVEVGADARTTIIEYQATAGDSQGFSVPRVSLDVASAARLTYARVQARGRGHRQVAEIAATVADQASLTVAEAAFGGSYSRLRSDIDLVGRGANGDLVAVYYGDDEQVLDFRTFQNHVGPDTTSELLFKGAVDDRSSSIYTGLIHIHPDGRGSNAHQTNRNIKLSDEAWAWSVPNLEIENSDVRCSHASTVSPVDADQRFYLHARGVPPATTDRLIVAGFFDEVIRRMPAGLVPVVTAAVAAKLDARGDEEVAP